MTQVLNAGHYQIDGTDRYESCKNDVDETYVEYRRRWVEYPKNNYLGEFPLHIDLESTNACNLRCEYCSRNFMAEKLGYMEFDLFKKCIDEASQYNLPSIKLKRIFQKWSAMQKKEA